MTLSKLHPPLSSASPTIQYFTNSQTETTRAEAVELYHRTYTTLLKSRGETSLKILESTHKAMGSSLHPLAASPAIDMGAFLYSIRRLPDSLLTAQRVLMGQSAEIFSRQGFPSFSTWKEVEAPGRRRRWYDNLDGTLAVLIASASDVDDLIPTLVACQIEWNKIHAMLRHENSTTLHNLSPKQYAEKCGGAEDDWLQLHEVWGSMWHNHLNDLASRSMSLKIQTLGGTQVGYGRVTRRWWQQVTGVMRSEGLLDRPIYFVSSNSHSIANLVTSIPAESEEDIVGYIEKEGPEYLRDELNRLREGQSTGSWKNFLYYAARLHQNTFSPSSKDLMHLKKSLHERGVINVSSRTALDIAAQVIPLDRLDPSHFDPRISLDDSTFLSMSRAVIINIDYPLGLAAYNILREVAETTGDLRGVYILGKAATLNADVGDVMISNVIHDEHSGSTYWLDNAFTVSDIAPYLRFGNGLDNQRAVSVKSTFLQNRGYLDFYYQEAFTVVEMETGPYCNAIYEISEAERYPIGEPVNFSQLPIDFGVIHYASDTPFTQARTLGARGLSYFGMDSTYASSVAIMHRIFSREKMLNASDSHT